MRTSLPLLAKVEEAVEGSPWVAHRYRTLVYRLRAYLALARSEEGYQTEVFPEGDGLAVSWRHGTQ